MGLGLTTIIIALIALPGLIVATIVRDVHDTAPPVFMDAGWKTLSSSMLAALVIHCVMIAASDLIAGHFPVPATDLVAANPNDEEWIPIPGESLGLKLRDWHSLNVDWFEVD